MEVEEEFMDKLLQGIKDIATSLRVIAGLAGTATTGNGTLKVANYFEYKQKDQ